jgi:aspartyl-tRNA(Asn)/glutamyl-tRNA(Gln) amidotransferase subunit C
MQHADDAEDVRAVVARTAALARLEVGDAEVERLSGEFARILAAFSHLAELDLVEGAADPGPAPGEARTRSDEPRPSGLREALLANAPEPIDGFFGVPKTIEDA